MQTKSYRFLKWTLLACVSASLASACVVTTGDGGGDDFFDEGGEGGSSTNTAGKTASGGAGTSATAGSGGKASGGGGSGTTAGSSGGGTAPAYVPGLCDAATPDQVEGPTPTEPADATITADDEKPANACRKCMKEKCTEEWSTCYGSAPTIACGSGATKDADGQFDCILGCFFDGAQDPMGTAEDLISDCSDMCTNQCADEDNGNVTVHTSALVECANDSDPAKGCQADCFPF